MVVVLCIGGLYFKNQNKAVSVNRADILIGQVKQGDLDVVIDGYGQLRSAKQQLVTALTNATVKEIVLKPGAEVTKDSVIVRLENPELQLQVQNDTQELALMQANLRQLKLNHKREVLNEKANVTAIESQYQSAKLRLEAQRALVADPAILLVDEPTGNLDSKSGDMVMEVLQQLNDQGTTICMVTHDPRYADMAKTQVRLLDGAILTMPQMKDAV
jgi:energy-coupling factor transporter ATP-binding protein EcfA2